MKSGVGASDEGHRLAETKYSVQGNGLHDQSEGASAYDASSQWLSSFQPPRRPLSVSSRSLRAKSGEILREKVGFQIRSLRQSQPCPLLARASREAIDVPGLSEEHADQGKHDP